LHDTPLFEIVESRLAPGKIVLLISYLAIQLDAQEQRALQESEEVASLPSFRY
jgi:hypothetical protein